jgi:CRP-like cAMP-binding protein
MSNGAELFNNSDLFKELPDAASASFLAVGVERTFAEGEVLSAEGTPGSEIFFILEGTATAGTLLSNADASTTVISAGAGTFLGLLNVFSDEGSPVSIIASTDVKVLVWSSAQWHALCKADPSMGYELAVTVAKTIARRMHDWHITVFSDIAWGLE